MKSPVRILSLLCALSLGACQQTIDVVTPNTRQQFDGLRVINAYKKQDLSGDSIFIEVGILSSYLYFSKSKATKDTIDGESQLVVSVYCGRTPDKNFVRTSKGTFLKKIWTEPRITFDRLFYKDDSGLHEVVIRKWNSDLDRPYLPPESKDPVSAEIQKTKMSPAKS